MRNQVCSSKKSQIVGSLLDIKATKKWLQLLPFSSIITNNKQN